MKQDITLSKILLLFFVVYFSCNSFLLTIKYSAYATVLMVLVVIISILISKLKGCYGVSRNCMALMCICLINVVLTAMFNGYMNAYMLLILNMVLCVSFIHLYSRQEFYEIYIVVMKIFAIAAIIVGLINILAPNILTVFKTYSYGESNSHLYIDAILSFQASKLLRINSIWGEPGMFSVFLIFALLLECFFVNRRIHVFNYVLFNIAILLTFSTNGLVCLLAVHFTVFFNNKRKGENEKIMLVFIVLIAAALFSMSRIDWLRESLIGATSKLDSEDISFAGRLAPLLYNIQEGLRSPFFGHGIRGGIFFVDYPFYSGYLICNTATTTLLFASFGIAYAAITVVLMWKFSKLSYTDSKVVKLLVFIIVIANVNTQAVHLDQIYYLLLFSVYMVDDVEPRIDQRQECVK